MKRDPESPFGPVRLLSARNRRELSINDQKAIQPVLDELDYIETEAPDQATRDLLLSAVITEAAARLLERPR